jgi:hypothetical protein
MSAESTLPSWFPATAGLVAGAAAVLIVGFAVMMTLDVAFG